MIPEWYLGVGSIFWTMAFFVIIAAVIRLADHYRWDSDSVRAHNARILLLTILLAPITGFVWPAIVIVVIIIALGFLIKTAFPLRDRKK